MHETITFLLVTLPNIHRFCQFFARRLSNKPFSIWLLTTSPYLKYAATLPCETLILAKQALNDKLQGSVAAYLRYGEVVNNQIKKGLLLSLRAKNWQNR